MALGEYIRKRRLERRKRRRARQGRSSSQPVGRWEELWLRYGTTTYLVAAMVLLYFSIRPGETALGRLEIGERAPETIVAPMELQYVDEERTEAERRKAEAEVRPVFSEVEGIERERMLRYGALLDRTAQLAGDRNAGADAAFLTHSTPNNSRACPTTRYGIGVGSCQSAGTASGCWDGSPMRPPRSYHLPPWGVMMPSSRRTGSTGTASNRIRPPARGGVF